ncbi:winged helix-turn-helix transcriptional regulator [Actinoplanes solisilvae]|uniref:winged helix-turn-helix transcriptional regulator n=1 Tax=Actinoplanes solisilvae TaxID=2486853 RepID=UPI000FDAAFD0|nr:helix-turn-helix domain-containing protein [Actinoplanes solisilvae]
MPTSRTYADACGIARALDVVGERWALLVVRELLLGPQRFTDLRRALPGASSNLLTDRLRELDAHGVISRRRLPPPASSWVYDLTARGRELEPIVLALGVWGVQFPLPGTPTTLSATSVLIYLRTAGRPDPQSPAYRLELDDRVWTVEPDGDRWHITPGEPPDPAATLRTSPKTFNTLLEDPEALDEALTTGTATATGDLPALRRLLASIDQGSGNLSSSQPGARMAPVPGGSVS